MSNVGEIGQLRIPFGAKLTVEKINPDGELFVGMRAFCSIDSIYRKCLAFGYSIMRKKSSLQAKNCWISLSIVQKSHFAFLCEAGLISPAALWVVVTWWPIGPRSWTNNQEVVRTHSQANSASQWVGALEQLRYNSDRDVRATGLPC